MKKDEGTWELAPGRRVDAAALDCGASGTMLRFLTAALTTLPGRWKLDGVPRLRERPLAPLLAALRRLGARIRCLRKPGHAPLEIEGGTLRGGETELDASASSQFLSALLMAALRAPRPVGVEVAGLTSEPYLDLTLTAIERFGGRVEEVLSPGGPAARHRFHIRPSPLVAGQ